MNVSVVTGEQRAIYIPHGTELSYGPAEDHETAVVANPDGITTQVVKDTLEYTIVTIEEGATLFYHHPERDCRP